VPGLDLSSAKVMWVKRWINSANKKHTKIAYTMMGVEERDMFLKKRPQND